MQYREVRSFWKAGFDWEVKRTGVAFLVLVLMGYAIGRFNPAITERVFAFLNSYYSGIDLEVESGSISALALFGNNAHACFLSILYGAIPFLRLTALSLGMNSLLLGVLAVYIQSNGYSLLYYLAGILPHGILEIPALVVTFSLGLYLCTCVTRQLRHIEGQPPFYLCMLNIGRTFLLIVLPLLAISSVVEVYLTPVIAELFL